MIRSFDHWNEDCLCPNIEQLLQTMNFTNWGPHNGRGWIWGDRLQLSKDRADIVGGMFAVDQQPIKPSACGQLRSVTIGKA
jgi:hypothetical protein